MRTCPTKGCHARIPDRLLMCRVHWRMVPQKIQRLVWRTYTPGQETYGGATPTEAYRAHVKDAIAAVDAALVRERERVADDLTRAAKARACAGSD